MTADDAICILPILTGAALALAIVFVLATSEKAQRQAEAAERMALIQRGCVPEFRGGGCGADYTRWHCGDGGTP